MSKKIFSVTVVIFFVLAGALYFLFFYSKEIDVEVEKVQKKDLVESISASGKLNAQKESTLFAPLSGEIFELKVSDGEIVQTETLLVIYDKKPFELSYNQAFSNYLATKVAQEQLDITAPLSEEILAAEALVSQTKESLKVAQKTYDDNPNDTTKAPLNAALTNYQNAQAALSRLRQNKPTDLTRQKVETDLASAFSAYQIAKSNLEKTEIKAPHAGTVLLEEISSKIVPTSISKLKPGMTVTQGQALFTIIDESSYIFEAEVDEADIRKINFSQDVVVSLDAIEDITLQGKVTFIAPSAHQIVEGETVYKVEIVLLRTDLVLKTGLTGDTEFILTKKENVLSIPFEALWEEGEKNSVFVQEGQNFVKRAINIGEEIDGELEVLSGLRAGELVAIEDLELIDKRLSRRLPF